MTNVTQDRHVTNLVPGPHAPALSDGSRLFRAMPSPVHEEFQGTGLLLRTGYKVDAVFVPHAPVTARSRFTSDSIAPLPTSQAHEPRAVLTAVKAAARRLRR